MEIAGFEDLHEIARGASAVVYRARQTALNRVVAVKVVHLVKVDESTSERFDRECRTAGQLGFNPRILPVYQAGTTSDGRPYLAMELMEGGTAAERMAEVGRLDEVEVVAIGIQMADALETVNQQGLVHRDVKPENVLIGRFGDVKLADFGIAASMGAGTGSADDVEGTIPYLAPEVLSGAPATPRSDVYALGATLFTLLHGSAAFARRPEESPFAVIARICDGPRPDLRADGVSPALADVVDRAMARDAAARTPSAGALMAELAELAYARGWDPIPTFSDRTSGPGTAGPTTGTSLATGSTRVRPRPPAPSPPPASRRPRRLLVAGLVALVAILVLAGAATALLGGRAGPTTTTTGTTIATTPTAQEVAEADPQGHYELTLGRTTCPGSVDCGDFAPVAADLRCGDGCEATVLGARSDDGQRFTKAFPLSLADGAHQGTAEGAASLGCELDGRVLDGEISDLDYELQITVVTATRTGDAWEADGIEGTLLVRGNPPEPCPNLDLEFRFTATRDG